MGYLVRGALVEYRSDFLGPLPNVVIFQFNPETLSRTIQIPPRPTASTSRETTQAGEPSIEKISLKASFSAADEMGESKPLARAFGVGMRLAALEKMVHPAGPVSSLIGAGIDAVKDLFGFGAGGDEPCAPIPREKYPRILFIWGPYRVLPVIIETMTITEQQYDFMLNPIQAEISISMAVNVIDRSADDPIGRGALWYSNLAKEGQAIANHANTYEQGGELIPF